MFTHQLQRIMQRDDRVRSRCLGVFPADELPREMPQRSMLIVNCCNRYYPGQHWLALCKDGDTLEIFDSFGLNPEVYNIVGKLPAAIALTYNTKQVQSINSEVCGQYCLYYCYYKARGYALTDIINVFSNDYRNNDNYVFNTVLDIYNLP